MTKQLSPESLQAQETLRIVESLNQCRSQQLRLLGEEKFLVQFDYWVPIVKEAQQHHKCALLEVLVPLGELCNENDTSGFMFSMLNAVIAEMAEPSVSARI